MRLPLLLAILFTPSLMASYESPDYKVVSAEGSYEIRDYPALTLVSTPMQNRSEDGSFMRLFGFISGSNDRGEKIAMTTPVLMSGENSGTMSFIVPKDVAAKGTPAPASREVSLSSVPTARYAVYRYSGWVNPKRDKAAAKKLLDWASVRHLETEGTPLFAYYNPPWTPWFMRRNEVLVKLVQAR
jgi:hypothetical protein